jgi:hypothetical protein
MYRRRLQRLRRTHHEVRAHEERRRTRQHLDTERMLAQLRLTLR